MKLSVVIPCFNEADTICEVVNRVREAGNYEKEIIIVDDASKDGTKEILERDIGPIVEEVIYHKRNKGKGAALRSGFRRATGDVVVV